MRQSDWCEIHTLMQRSDWCEQHTTLQASIEFFFFLRKKKLKYALWVLLLPKWIGIIKNKLTSEIIGFSSYLQANPAM